MNTGSGWSNRLLRSCWSRWARLGWSSRNSEAQMFLVTEKSGFSRLVLAVPSLVPPALPLLFTTIAALVLSLTSFIRVSNLVLAFPLSF